MLGPWAYATTLWMLSIGLASLWLGGPWVWFLPVFAFVAVPLLEQWSQGSKANPTAEEEQQRKNHTVFDALLFATIPLHLALLGSYLWLVSRGAFAGGEAVGAFLTAGISCGTYGINAAHEMGHRPSRRWRAAARTMLFTSLYTHFLVEHNRGHHKHVSTEADPASAPRGQSVYGFWARSISGSARHAWQLEARRCHRKGWSVLSWHNEVLVGWVLQVLAIVAVGLALGAPAAFAWLGAGFVGILLLETVNYVEHYGLRRAMGSHGRPEPVRPVHSWNSNRLLGRALLFDLTRHSDHHAHASRAYPLLRHHDDAPQMPAGYPAMILLSLAPPLFFRAIHPVLDRLTDARHST